MNKLYEKLADLVIKRGVNVQEGQLLVIRAAVRDCEFVRLLAEKAYQRGACEVQVDWRDETLTKLGYKYRTKENLSVVEDWVHDREQNRHDQKCCYLNVVSDAPGILKDVDGEKIAAASRAFRVKMADLNAYTMNNIGQWCVCGLPSAAWAKEVFPDLSEEEAYAKLEEAIFMVSRVSEDNDPEADWEKHDAELIGHAQKMTAYNFEKIHFTSELGTDITVGLVDSNVWIGGGTTTPAGVYFDPNIPTEECFSMPHRDRVDGIVHASRPLNYQGRLIENFWFRFENGKVVDYGAEKGAEMLKELLDTDEGAMHLGEVALVPYNSPVSLSGILFLNTLYDENAACHLALGRCYPENVVGGVDMSKEELHALGANDSLEHVDFMFGTKELCADGIRKDGTVVPVFRHGGFVL